jgi:hypothetical protein
VSRGPRPIPPCFSCGAALAPFGFAIPRHLGGDGRTLHACASHRAEGEARWRAKMEEVAPGAFRDRPEDMRAAMQEAPEPVQMGLGL